MDHSSPVQLPRSFSDPFSHDVPSSSSPILPLSSPEPRVRYAVGEPPRRASWAPAPRTAARLRDPLTEYDTAGPSTRAAGKVAYGPGFYIPPPGYAASSLRSPLDQRGDGTGGGWDGKRRSLPLHEGRLQPRPGDAVEAHPLGETNPASVCPRSQRGLATTSSSTGGSASTMGMMAVWAILALLLAGVQSLLLGIYTQNHSQPTLCAALSWAALSVELYAALVAALGMLGSAYRPHALCSCRSGSQPPNQSLRNSIADSLTTVSALSVALGATLQLTALIVYAVQSTTAAMRYSVGITLAIMLVTTAIWILWNLHCTGHLSHRRGSADAPRRGSGAERKHASVSSHGERYVPDYGLNSDTDSSDDDVKRPRADWTDRVLDGLIRSPLLDMPKHA